jgi:hypothetical protein
VSTILHATIDFDYPMVATKQLTDRLVERLKEQNFVNDARVQMAIAGLSGNELDALRQAAQYPPGMVWGAQGQRTLTPVSGKDLHQEIDAPSRHAAFHDVAMLAGVLLDQAQCHAA